MRDRKIESIKEERESLEAALSKMISNIGEIPIANKRVMPYGWRKSAKGRTVWRIVEEVISQNIEKYHKELGFPDALPAESEVGVYDLVFVNPEGNRTYINIKSAVKNGRRSKDDVSKAVKLLNFYEKHPSANLYIATFVLSFNENMTVSIEECIVFPVSWIPDIYVNPSNNGNLQSSYYKDLNAAHYRTNEAFVKELKEASEIAIMKKRAKIESINFDNLK